MPPSAPRPSTPRNPAAPLLAAVLPPVVPRTTAQDRCSRAHHSPNGDRLTFTVGAGETIPWVPRVPSSEPVHPQGIAARVADTPWHPAPRPSSRGPEDGTPATRRWPSVVRCASVRSSCETQPCNENRITTHDPVCSAPRALRVGMEEQGQGAGGLRLRDQLARAKTAGAKPMRANSSFQRSTSRGSAFDRSH